MDDRQEQIKDQVSSFTSQIDASQEEMRARVSAIQYKMEVRIKCSQEKMKAMINSIWDELEKTKKHRVEDVLACVDQRTEDLYKELNEKNDETQVDKDVRRYAEREPPGSHNKHKGASSRRASGRDTVSEGPN
jgi:hypothetical protein